MQWREDGRKRQKNFQTKEEAQKFADYLALPPKRRGATIKVADLIDEYRKIKTIEKSSSKEKYARLGRLMQRPFAQKTFDKIWTCDIENYLRDRQDEPSSQYNRKISSTTLIRELSALSVVFTYAIRRGLMENNPVAGVKRPAPALHRERVASDEDIKQLMHVANWDGKSPIHTETQLVLCLFLLACRTGMSAGELLNIERSWIKPCGIQLPGVGRTAALLPEARVYLDLILALGYKPKIVGTLTDIRRDTLWRKLRDRAGVFAEQDTEGRVLREGLNFNDSITTFATWAASPDPTTGVPRFDLLALARQTGRRDLRKLERFYRAADSTDSPSD